MYICIIFRNLWALFQDMRNFRFSLIYESNKPRYHHRLFVHTRTLTDEDQVDSVINTRQTD